jgi:nicotinate-nucleotide adenylyltransferase
MCAKKRIALYGGTFDPVHVGHLEIARRVSELFEIERVLFIPAQTAPHKIGRLVTDPLHRFAMLVLATQDDPTLEISTFEIEAPDRRYTVDTLAHFVNVLGDSSELFFIMGADSWAEISTWRDWQRLLTMVNHIVVTRPGYRVEGPPSMSDRVIDIRSQPIPAKLDDCRSDMSIFLTDVVMKDVSATQIRSFAHQGRFEELEKLVSPPVAQYIEKYGIYQESNEA